MRSATSIAPRSVVEVLEQDGELVAAEAGRGVGRAQAPPASRSVTATSSSSPAAWPRLSLTVLKLSRSRNSTARWPPRAARPRERVLDAVEEQARLARPVSESWNAWCASSLLEPLSLGDVAEAPHPADDLAVDALRLRSSARRRARR